MKISGVDPVVIEQVKEQVVRPAVRELQETRITREYKEQEFRQGQGQKKDGSDTLQQSVEQLNLICQTMSHPISFRLVEKDSDTKVEVVDNQDGRVLKEVDPGEVVAVVTQVDKLLGLLIDTLV